MSSFLVGVHVLCVPCCKYLEPAKTEEEYFRLWTHCRVANSSSGHPIGQDIDSMRWIRPVFLSPSCSYSREVRKYRLNRYTSALLPAQLKEIRRPGLLQPNAGVGGAHPKRGTPQLLPVHKVLEAGLGHRRHRHVGDEGTPSQVVIHPLLHLLNPARPP